MTPHYYPIIYASFYLALFLFSFRLGDKAKIGRILLFIYFVCAASSIYYYFTGPYYGDNLRLIPYLYLFVTSVIGIQPFLNTRNIIDIPVHFSERSERTLDALSVVLGIFSFWWFFELLFIASHGISDINLVTNYEGYDYTGERISWLGRKFKLVCIYSIDIIYFLFFYQLAKNKNRILTILLGLGTLASPFDALIGGHRFMMVFSLVRYLIFYLLFQPVLSSRIKKMMLLAGTTIMAFVVLGITIITMARFNSQDSTSLDLLTWISLYSGEGPLRFNLQAWEMPVHTQGDNTLTLIKDVIGMNPACEMEDRELVWGNKHGLNYGVYYTYIGDLFFDFGKVGTAIVILLYCIVANYIISRYTGKPGYLLLIAELLLFVMFGVLYNPFILYRSQVALIIAIAFSMWLNVQDS